MQKNPVKKIAAIPTGVLFSEKEKSCALKPFITFNAEYPAEPTEISNTF